MFLIKSINNNISFSCIIFELRQRNEMFIVPVILFYKLLKRFPLLLLVCYCGSFFLESKSLKEVEEEDRIEQCLQPSVLQKDVIFASLPRLSFSKVANHFQKAGSVFRRQIFILTARYKLYVLFSKLLLGRVCVN
jgi:hypothetical protein